MTLNIRIVGLAVVPILATGLLTGCASETSPKDNLSPLSSASPSVPSTQAPEIANDGTFASVLNISIALAESDGLVEEQTSEGEEPFWFAYAPSLPVGTNAAIILQDGEFSIPVPANNLGQQENQGKGALHILFRENANGVMATKTDSGFSFTGSEGTNYTVTVEGDLITKVIYDGVDAAAVTSTLTYAVTDEQRALISTAHNPAG